MTRKQHHLGLALAVALGSLVLLLELLALVSSADGADGSGAGRVPLLLGGLVVVGTLLALGWRAVTRSHSDR